ncbi:MAG TPA: hypothetical protein VEK32_01275 [Thermodesulfobacteriota bacterium]|nr:hypothetical protein [Thermodesulfobacteriota bacterium]
MKRILSAIILVFCLSGVAKAESWILYRHVTEGNTSSWFIEEAFPSYNSCKEVFDRKLVFTEIHEKDWTLTHFNDNGFMEVKKGMVTLVEFLCLPSTIDPRK